MLEQWNLDKMQMKDEHETEKRNMKEIFNLTIADRVNTLTVYYEGKLQDMESACSIKIKTLNKKFTDDLINLNLNFFCKFKNVFFISIDTNFYLILKKNMKLSRFI